MTLIHTLKRFLACAVLAFLVPAAAQAQTAAPQAPALQAPQVRFQFAIYYPTPPQPEPMAVLQRRLAASPGMPKLVQALPDTASEPVLAAQWVTQARQRYAPPLPQAVQYFGRGLSQAQAQALQGADQVLVIDFAHPARLAMPALRQATLLVEQVARDSGGLPWDDETREVFTPEAWHQRRLEGWQGELPDVVQHTVIHAYKNDPLVRAISLGMAKFGLPDVVVQDFSWSGAKGMGNLVNLLCQALVEGAPVPLTGAHDLKIDTLRHAAVRQRLLDSRLANSEGVARLVLKPGRAEQGDPANRLMEIGFDRYAGPDLYARQTALIGSLFGSEDGVSYLKHNEALLAASRAAQAQLPALRTAFGQGLQPGEFLLLKAPFKTRDGGKEWMWVEVTGWQGGSIRGMLKNEPRHVEGLHAGQAVTVQQDDIFDFIRHYPDGREEGNETGRIIQKMQATK